MASSPERIEKKRIVYFKIVGDYPGSWVFEYWTYYPYDAGPTGRHPHDTEHVFVEVDWIGGRVLGVFAAAHGDFAPNNIYSVFNAHPTDPVLPICVLVERGKHALAPDINHDGKFSPGLDVNAYSQISHVWGVRDVVGGTDADFLSYQPFMTLDRDKSDAWIPQRFTDYFPMSAFGAARFRYDLRPFPTAADTCEPEDHRDASTTFKEECANLLLEMHPDAIDPNHIIKPWVFPYHQLRAGYARIGGGSEVSIGFVSDLNHLGLSRLPGLSKIPRVPLPGRLAFELLTSPQPTVVRPFKDFTSPFTGHEGRAVLSFVGAQYENHITNVFGLFGGYFRSFRARTSTCEPVERCSAFDTIGVNYYHLGFFAQFPRFPQSDDLDPYGNRTGPHMQI